MSQLLPELLTDLTTTLNQHSYTVRYSLPS